MRRLVLSIALCTALLAFGQQSPTPERPTAATITFTRDWPRLAPMHWAIAVDETCAATYESSTDWPPLPSAVDDQGTVKFTMSPANCHRIFALAAKLDFFAGSSYDYHPGKIANTGTKTLRYSGTNHQGENSYNYSDNSLVQELTKLFSDTADTIQAGAKIARDHQHDRLALVADLKELDENSRSHNLAEVQVIAPVLEQVANDPAIINMARDRALRVLDRAGLLSRARVQP